MKISPAYPTPENIVTAKVLNIRNNFYITGEVLGYLTRHERIEIFDCKNNWYRIHPSKQRWCSGAYIKTVSGIICGTDSAPLKASDEEEGIILTRIGQNQLIPLLALNQNHCYYLTCYRGICGFVAANYIIRSS